MLFVMPLVLKALFSVALHIALLIFKNVILGHSMVGGYLYLLISMRLALINRGKKD